MTAMTLPLPADLHELYRREAFERRTSITKLIVDRLRDAAPTGTGCDVCGAPATPARPQGFRFCAEHGGRS